MKNNKHWQQLYDLGFGMMAISVPAQNGIEKYDSIVGQAVEIVMLGCQPNLMTYVQGNFGNYVFAWRQKDASDAQHLGLSGEVSGKV